MKHVGEMRVGKLKCRQIANKSREIHLVVTVNVRWVKVVELVKGDSRLSFMGMALRNRLDIHCLFYPSS